MKCEDCGGDVRWNYFDRKYVCSGCGNEIPGRIREGDKQKTLKEYTK